MITKRLFIGAISTSLVALTLITQSANATEPLTESQAITKVQYLVDSLNSEIVTGSSQSDAWTSDFPLMQTQLDALSIQLNAFGNRFASSNTSITHADSELSDCVFSQLQDSYELTCNKKTVVSMFAGEEFPEAKNFFAVKVTFNFTSDQEIASWSLVNDISNETLPTDEISFANASLDVGVSFPRATRILPPLDGWTGLSNARKLQVVSYALEFDVNPNPAYWFFSDTDCANFASQAMKAGGWKTVGNGHFDNRKRLDHWGYWTDNWYPYNYTTETWTVANSLYLFTTQSTTRGLKIGTFQNNELLANQDLLEPGDLIFINYEGPAEPNKDHVVIVTSNVDGLIRVSGHTNTRHNALLSKLLQSEMDLQHIDARWFFVRT
ncbi:MAG: hypothetical protein RL228_382 [Actinomycetota bacterium]